MISNFLKKARELEADLRKELATSSANSLASSARSSSAAALDQSTALLSRPASASATSLVASPDSSPPALPTRRPQTAIPVQFHQTSTDASELSLSEDPAKSDTNTPKDLLGDRPVGTAPSSLSLTAETAVAPLPASIQDIPPTGDRAPNPEVNPAVVVPKEVPEANLLNLSPVGKHGQEPPPVEDPPDSTTSTVQPLVRDAISNTSESTPAPDTVEVLQARNQALEAALLSFRNKAKERITAFQQKLQSEKALAQEQRETWETQLLAVQQENVQFRKALEKTQDLEVEVVSLREELAKRAAALAEKETEIQHLTSKQSKVHEEETDANKKIVQNDQEQMFQLEETIRELKLQLSSRQMELASIQEAHTKLKAENDKMLATHEEKIKKVKGLFAIANKTIAEQKQQLQKFEEESAEMTLRIQTQETENGSLKTELEHLRVQFKNQEVAQSNTQQDAHLRLEKITDELNHIKVEYQAYKTRAHLALSDKAAESSKSQLLELDRKFERAEKEKSELIVKMEELRQQNTTLKAHLEEISEQNHRLLEINTRLSDIDQQRKTLEHEISRLMVAMHTMERKHAAALLEKENAMEQSMSGLRDEMRRELIMLNSKLAAKESEIASLEQIMEKLNEDLYRSRNDASSLREQMKEAMAAKTLSGDSAAHPLHINTEMPSDNEPTVKDGSGSYVDLKHLVPQSPTLYSSMKEEYEAKVRTVVEALNEYEQKIRQFSEREEILKEEIRKHDRMEKLQNLNVPYLKNVILEFLASQNKEKLLPVVRQLLQLDDQETKKIRDAISGKWSIYGF